MSMDEGYRRPRLDLAAIRERLASRRGPEYWRSLEELAESEEFLELLHREFPAQASERADLAGRRKFLKLMAASVALAGLGACTRQPEEKILPYARSPEEIIPGKPLFFATAFTLGGHALGVLAESHMGRPTKIEGNLSHPASMGATDAFAQASVLEFYDPDRAQVVQRNGQISTWNTFTKTLDTEMEVQSLKRGAGLRLLTETVTSPTLAYQIRSLLSRFPEAKWHQYEPLAPDEARQGALVAFGEFVDIQYHFEKAKIVLALDSDFLSSGPGKLRYARDFVERRRIFDPRLGANRLYSVESTPSNTGAMADHRLPLKPSQIEHFARLLATKLNAEVEPTSLPASHHWIDPLARDLEKHRGSSIVIAGDHQPATVHALVHRINHVLGNVGNTIVYTEPVEAHPVHQIESLRELVHDIKAGRVDILAILGANPVFTAPADLEFDRHLRQVRQRIHLSLFADETSALCQWHIPAVHYLESWSDARAYDGSISIVQPLVAPLYDGKSPHELLAALRGDGDRSSHEIVQQFWQEQQREEDFEQFWQKALHDGIVRGSALPPKQVSLRTELPNQEEQSDRTQSIHGSMEITFRPDPTIYDGRFANNGWLQELPKPITKVTWDNPALISPGTAERIGLANQEVAELQHADRMIQLPVWITPGHPDDCVTLYLGYGREHAGRVGSGAGFNTYQLRTSTSPWFASGLQIRKTGKIYPLASSQHHHLIDPSSADRQTAQERPLVRSATVEEYRENPNFAQEMTHAPEPETTLYPAHHYEGHAWGMAINLNACIGCNACVVACQSENNIPVVGKEEVLRGREMHWIRVDRYYKGNLDNPSVYYQPVPCMHCENAPCEPVCPVGATVHGNEGLNEMVYNRCVGTRYCSNNCPYKVRRFNFLLYSDFETPSLKRLNNPDVTVRSRGVMEKCTYCVQRINSARIAAKKENREIQDGEVVTACQQVCPTRAITFGDVNDSESRVTRMKNNPLNYGLLEELNTRPRTTYWARLHNPNPDLGSGKPK